MPEPASRCANRRTRRDPGKHLALLLNGRESVLSSSNRSARDHAKYAISRCSSIRPSPRAVRAAPAESGPELFLPHPRRHLYPSAWRLAPGEWPDHNARQIPESSGSGAALPDPAVSHRASDYQYSSARRWAMIQWQTVWSGTASA